MAYDEGLATRIRELLGERSDVVEKRMFGGLAFLVGGNMSVGIIGDDLIARVGPARLAEALARPHARPFDFTGRPMKGWLYVAPAGLEDDRDLAQWIAWGVETAAASPKKAKMAKKAKIAARPPAMLATPAAKPPKAAKMSPTSKAKIGKAAAKRTPSGRRR